MKNQELSRGQFLRQLGLSSGALMAFYCLGTVTTACSKAEDPEPTTSGGGSTGGGGVTNTNTGITGTTSGSVDFTIDLTHKDNTKLKTEGEYALIGDVIVANVKGGKFVALSKACTHEGTSIQYRLTQNDFWCSNHGSEFAADGSVERSPATKALKVYKTESLENGNKLRVTA